MTKGRILGLGAIALGAVMLVAPSAFGFYIIGASAETSQEVRLYRWALSDMDTNNDGDVSGDDEGIEITLESGDYGFTLDEMDVVKEAFDVWESVSTSYAAFHFTDPVPECLETTTQVDGINFVNIAFDKTGIEAEQASYTALNGYWAYTLLYMAAEDTFVDSRDGSFSFPVTGGQIFETEIMVDGAAVRAASSSEKAKGDLLGLMVWAIGVSIGLSNDSLHNVEYNEEYGVYTEEPGVALRGPDGVLREVGVTPSMFNFVWYVGDTEDSLVDGARDLAPSDISAVSYLYPRGNLEEYFNVAHEARTFERPNFPSYPMLGAHVIAWCDADNNASTPRVPFMATMTGLYRHVDETNMVGKFENRGLFRQLETTSEETFEPSYVFTVSAIPGGDEVLETLAADPKNRDTKWYDSTHGGDIAEDSPAWTVAYEADKYYFPSEVFREGGNLFGLDLRDQGTPLVYDAVRRKVVSATSGKTLDRMLPFTWPMFGEPNMVCPYNITYAGIDTDNVPKAFRSLRDGALLASPVGAAFVDAYYRVAPSLAQFLLHHAFALKTARLLAEGAEWTFLHLQVVLGLALSAILVVAAWRWRGHLRGVASVLLFVGLLLAFASPAHARGPLFTTEELVARADVIIEGSVLAVEARWDEGTGTQRGIVTDVTIEVTDSLKGRTNKSSTIHLVLPGGRVGDIIAACPEMPKFEVDQDIMLYLKLSPQGAYYLAAGDMSKWNVTKASDSDVKALRTKGLHRDDSLRKELNAKKSADASTISVDEDGQPQSDENWVLLDDYKEYIRDIVREQGRTEK